MKDINWLNSLEKEAEKKFLACCASKKWANSMVKKIPFANFEQLLEVAKIEWFALAKEDKMEAFRAHPTIGDISALKKKSCNNERKTTVP